MGRCPGFGRSSSLALREREQRETSTSDAGSVSPSSSTLRKASGRLLDVSNGMHGVLELGWEGQYACIGHF